MLTEDTASGVPADVDLDLEQRILDTRRLLVVGPAGSGKSFRLRSAKALLERQGHLAVLIYLRDIGRPEEIAGQVVQSCLREVAARRISPPPALARFTQPAAAQGVPTVSGEVFRSFIDALLPLLSRDRRLILLFDGIDEARFPPRFATFLETVTSDLPPLIHSVVTARSTFLAERFAAWDSLALGPAAAWAWREAAELDPAAAAGPASAQRLVKALALLSPSSLALLVAASRLQEEDVRRQLAMAESIGQVTLYGEQARFAREADRERVVRALLIPALRLENLQFGAEAAEIDRLLQSCFQNRSDLELILDGRKTVILGDRGAGKSALFGRLEDSVGGGETGRGLVVAKAQDPANVLRTMTVGAAAVASPEEFKAMWLLYLAALAARQLQSKGRPRDPLEKRHARAARTILRSFGWSSKIQSEGWLSRAWHAVAGATTAKVKISVGPIAIEPTGALNGAGAGRTPRRRFEVYDFLELTDRLLVRQERQLLVAIDQVDEAHKYERPIQEAMIQGLMLAESYIAQRQAMRLAVFLRCDLWETYDIQEKNKFVLRTIWLSWAAHELESLLLDRLCSNPCFGEIAAMVRNCSPHRAEVTVRALRCFFPPEIERTAFPEWLFAGLRNARDRVSPRQVILFLNLCRDSALREAQSGSGPRQDGPVFGDLHVREAMTQLSELSYNEVISDFRVAKGFVKNLRAANRMEFDLQEVNELFDPVDGSIADQVTILERLGFLGRKVDDAGGLRLRFTVPPLYTRCWEQMVAATG